MSRHCQAALNQIANAGQHYEVLSKCLKWWLAVKGASATGSLPSLSAQWCLSRMLFGDCHQKDSWKKNQEQNRTSTALVADFLLWPCHGHTEDKPKVLRICLVLGLVKQEPRLQGICSCKGSLQKGTTAVTAPPSGFPPFLPVGPKAYRGTRCAKERTALTQALLRMGKIH